MTKNTTQNTKVVSDKSFQQKPLEVKRSWVLVDASGMALGRLASQVAVILRGKNKPTFTPNVDCGDYVVIINSDKVVLTGNKMNDKYYFKHSGYVGGAKYTQAKVMHEKHSDRMVEKAIKGMLPKNALGRKMYRKLKVYKNDVHPHEAQQPKKIKLIGGAA